MESQGNDRIKKSGIFKKGNSIGATGKPKGRTFATIMKEMAEQLGEGEVKGGRTKKEVIIDKLLLKAQRGERWAVECVLDRMEGKAVSVQQIDMTTGGQAFNASVSFCRVGEIPVQASEVKTVDALPAVDNEPCNSAEIDGSEEVKVERKKIQW